MRSENAVFEIDLEIKALTNKIEEMTGNRSGVKELKDLINRAEGMTNKEMVEIILKNIEELKDSVP